MFPSIAVSFSNPDPELVQNMAASVNAMHKELNSRAVREFTTGYADYISKADKVKKEFYSRFDRSLGSITLDTAQIEKLLKKSGTTFDSALLEAKVGYFGKLKDGKFDAGIAALANLEIDSPRVTLDEIDISDTQDVVKSIFLGRLGLCYHWRQS